MQTKLVALFVGVFCLGAELRADYLLAGTNVGADGITRSASANFQFTSGSQPQLVITLANTSMDDVLAPNQVLTGMFMNVNNNPTFTPVSAQVASGSTVLFPNVSGDCVASPTTLCSGPDVSGEWAYKSGLSGAPFGLTYGISSSGLGLFGAPDLFGPTNLQGPPSPDGLQYGITSQGDNPTTGNTDVTGKYALIQNSVVITLNLPTSTTFKLADIGGVGFQYGTALTDADFLVLPEPSSYMAAIFLMLVPLVLVQWKRRAGRLQKIVRADARVVKAEKYYGGF